MESKMQGKKHVELVSLFKKDHPDHSKCEKTIEIVVEMMEPTSECYTEIDYELEFAKITESKQSEKRNNSILNSFNSDDDNDDDVKNIAAKLEVKYGSKLEKFSENQVLRNYSGYESDSFIDNSEAFDEYIPNDISTLYGGFYINVGPLIFKREEQKDDKEYTRVGKYTSLSKPKNELLKELDQKLFTVRKGKLQVENKKVLVRKENEKMSKSNKNHPKEIKRKSTFPLTSFENMFQELKEKNADSDRSASDVAGSSDSDQPISVLPNEDKIPTDFPSDVVNSIENIKKAVSGSPEGKPKNRGLVNTLLLKLEYKCRRLDKSIRIKVYDHLAPYVKCQRKSLTKRAKNLYVTAEYRKVKELLEKFKIAVHRLTDSISQKAQDSQVPKLFIWDDEAKELLKDAMDMQRNCFKLEGKKNETIERRLVEFVQTTVLPIWPESWMSASELLNYYDSISNREEKLSDILEQSSSGLDLRASIASLAVNPPSLEITSDKLESIIDLNENEEVIIIDLTI